MLEEAPRRRFLPTELFAQYKQMDRICGQKSVNLIHVHGIWAPLLCVAALLAHNRRLPLVISPHGCLDPYALGLKRAKKLLALKTYQGAILQWAALFMATSEQEARSIRLLGLRQPVAIVPNGVDSASCREHGRSRGAGTILFLSRIHPQKGLLDLVEAWGRVRKPGWKIVVAGDGEQGHRDEVEARVRAKGLEADFEFPGFVDGARKQACFDDADLFVLPTYSESFGIAVGEALANELPVITTTGAPWRDLEEWGCGWWVGAGVEGLSAALKDAMEREPEELRQMGKRGRQLVVEKYSWDRAAETVAQVGEWLLDRSLPTPCSVRHDEEK